MPQMCIWTLLAGIFIFLSGAFSQGVVNTTVNPRTLHPAPLEKGWIFQTVGKPESEKESPPMGDSMLTGLGGDTSFTFEGIQIFVFGHMIGTMKTIFQVDGDPATTKTLNNAPPGGLLGATVLLYNSPALPSSSHVLDVFCSPDSVIYAETMLTNFTITSIQLPVGGTSVTQSQPITPTGISKGKPSFSAMPSSSSPSTSPGSLAFDSSALSSSTPSSTARNLTLSPSTPSSPSSPTQHAPDPSLSVEVIRTKKSGLPKGLIGGLIASLLSIAALLLLLFLRIRRRRRIREKNIPRHFIQIAKETPPAPENVTAIASGSSNDSESLLSESEQGQGIEEPQVQVRSSGAMLQLTMPSTDQSRAIQTTKGGGVRLAGGPLTSSRGSSIASTFDQSDVPPAYAVQ